MIVCAFVSIAEAIAPNRKSRPCGRVRADARRQDVDVWLDVDDSDDTSRGGYSVRAMAALFSRSQVLTVDLEPKRDLAGLISCVLTHDEVPNIVHEKLTDALVELHDSTDVYDDEAAVRALLGYHARRRAESEQAEEEGGAGK